MDASRLAKAADYGKKGPRGRRGTPPYLHNNQFTASVKALVGKTISMGNGQQTETTKASNPKEAFGDLKMPLGLFPDTALVEANLAFLEGALKYGQFNWRVAGVKSSTYNRAMRRHLSKWWNGQDRDPATRVRELASVMACCAIMIDAELCGKLTDDRPPRADMEAVLGEAAKVAAHLKQLFANHNPPQYTEREHGGKLTARSK